MKVTLGYSAENMLGVLYTVLQAPEERFLDPKTVLKPWISRDNLMYIVVVVRSHSVSFKNSVIPLSIT